MIVSSYCGYMKKFMYEYEGSKKPESFGVGKNRLVVSCLLAKLKRERKSCTAQHVVVH